MSAPSFKTDALNCLRILDANANRAAEGLRVVEEYLRFVLEDRHLAGLCKRIRHDLEKILGAIPMDQRFLARDTPSDVGTMIRAVDEYQRQSTSDVALANQKRVEQAFRCLEEYSKPLFPNVAASIERLRYEVYTMARSVAITTESRTRLEEAYLYVLVDGRTSEEDFTSFVQQLVTAHVDVLQLRDKSLGDRELLMRAKILRTLTQGSETLFIMNDRPDLAVLARADGVHLGQTELSVRDARKLLGESGLIGVSTHSIEQARQAVLEGANYIGCGPTFPSTTKPFASYPGTDFLQQVAEEISLPAFAIGGITLDNLASVLATGFLRIALSSAVTLAKDPAKFVQQLQDAIRNQRRAGGRQPPDNSVRDSSGG